QTDRALCTGCGRCVTVCPSGARRLVGTVMTVPDVVSEIESDTAFFDESGGGVTLSGGDPLLQPEFATAILAKCQRLRIHTTLDTCGYAPWEDLEQVARVSDLVLYDLKHMNDAQHVRWTTQSNVLILDNLVRLDTLGKSLWIRIPFIPEINDNATHWRTLGAFIATLQTVEAIHLLPYHRAGEAKQLQLERTSIESFPVPEEDAVAAAAKLIEDATGRSVYIGG
ncbi:glycyl-radical enzyme activating protein, partial [Candidatus Bipolaricaulota bacterium]|nr:glycyl-radical enzyme activating protein [Candidatus Bipolaricaulota bacterium]